MKSEIRLYLLILLIFVQILYFPINRLVKDGVTLELSFEDNFPLLPIWAIPYLLSLIWWIGSFIWAFKEMDDLLFKRLILTMLFVNIVSFITYILYPTYVERPEIIGEGLQYDLMRFIYRNDRAYNAFPSSHTYTSTVIMIFWWKWYPRKWWLWSGIALIVLFSTLFTRQHYVIDLLGGILIAFIGYGISRKVVKPKSTKNNFI